MRSLDRGAWAARLGWLLMLGLAVAVAALIALPLLRLVVTSVTTEPGAFSVAPYVEAFGKLRHLAALGRSVLLGIGAVLLSGLIGITLAWLVSRTDMAGKRLVTLAVVATFVMPPYLGAVAWMLLGGPNAGWINKAWIALGGNAPLLNIYSFGGLVFLVALYLFPYSGKGTTLAQRLRDPRNVIYYTTGLAIVVGIVWTLVNAFVRHVSIFVPETVAIVAFSISWLVKGRIELFPGELIAIVRQEERG